MDGSDEHDRRVGQASRGAGGALYRTGQGRLRTAPAPAVGPTDSGSGALSDRKQGRREAGRGIPRKSRTMYAVITDFSLQSQRSQKPGTELGMPWACAGAVPVGWARRGRGHTKWRDRRRHSVPIPVRTLLAHGRASPAAAARERPRGTCMTRCTRLATVPRSASLRGWGTWAMRAQRCHTHLSDPRSVRRRALAEACMPGCTPPAPRGSGGCSHGIHAPAGEGWAGRLTSSRRTARPRCARLSRAGRGSGCPLRPRWLRSLEASGAGVLAERAEWTGEQAAKAEGGCQQAGD